MWKNQTVGVVFSTYNEKDSIRQQIEDCFATGFVDEVIVVNNNASAGTDEEVRKTKAKLVYEKKQGYGYGYRTGLREVKTGIIIMSEPDGTFDHKRDIPKLLIYSDDFSVVFGTRTTQALIHQGANMGIFLKWGNVFVAKLIEVFFSTTHLSDVGCTLRLYKRKALHKIMPHFSIGGNYFSPEMIVLTAMHRIPFVEIPVNFLQRIGESRGAANFLKAFKLGMYMIGLICYYRINSIVYPKRYK
ncbi:MAG: glycosyltransferase family 2 protein [Candidatus Aenigmarchaeota archaeon]|nr:glycosyltransferase family 2 protein [Candidatus Aenigmarchaeota archaeon]